MKQSLDYLRKLREQGGPQVAEYAELDAWLVDICNRIRKGDLSKADIGLLRDAFGDSFSTETMQGFAFRKPHGYAGDYEIIDRIYQTYVSPLPHLSNWDKYWQSHAAAEAVRYRKSYMHEVINRSVAARRGTTVRVLNVASGPGRDMLEYFQSHDPVDVRFTCLEQDAKAIEYASALCSDYIERIAFVPVNVLRYRPRAQYDLVWSAGLFDYFDDKTFKRLLTRLLPALAAGGDLVVGNFSDRNPSRHYMELFDWMLHHRSPERLASLARECGVPTGKLHIGAEPTGVNLFLHIQDVTARTMAGAVALPRPFHEVAGNAKG